MSVYLFNITEIKGNNNRPIMIEFYGGDITEIYSDILLVSAYKSSYIPTKNSIFYALKERLNIEFGSSMPEGSVKLNDYLYQFNIEPTLIFKRLWVLEISNLSSSENKKTLNLKLACNSLSKIGAVFDSLNIDSISLPLIGTGSQKINKMESVSELMNVIKKWAAYSNSLNTVRIFAYDLESAALISRGIDNHFGFSIDQPTESARLLLQAATEELKHFCTNIDEETHKEILDLYNISCASYTSVKSIAVSGRVIAEKYSGLLASQWFLYENLGNLSLNNRIKKIQNKLNKEKPWILSYFRLLQSCGNIAAHPNQLSLNIVDACAVIISSIRIADYTFNQLKANSN